MAEVRCGEVDDQLGLGRHRVDDLEVEHGFALGLLRRAPAWVTLHGQHRRERRKAVLGREFLEVAEVREVVDLGQHDGLPRAVEAGVAQRLDVVVAQDVGGDQAARPHGVSACPSVVVETAHIGDDCGESGRKARLVTRSVKRRPVRQAVAFDADGQQGGGRRGGAVGGDDVRWPLPACLEACGVERLQGARHEGGIRTEVGGVSVRIDRPARGNQTSEQILVANLEAEAQVHGRRSIRGTQVDRAADCSGQRRRWLGDRTLRPRLLGRARPRRLACRKSHDHAHTDRDHEPQLHWKEASQNFPHDRAPLPSPIRTVGRRARASFRVQKRHERSETNRYGTVSDIPWCRLAEEGLACGHLDHAGPPVSVSVVAGVGRLR